MTDKHKNIIHFAERIEDGTESTSGVFDIQAHTQKKWYDALIQRVQKNPERIEKLHEALNVMDEDKEKWRNYEREWASAHHKIPLEKINIDLENFQNRRAPYSEYSVQGIIDAIYSGEFKKALFNPLILRKNGDGKNYILAGHSRHEAFCRLKKLAETDPFIADFCKKHEYYFDTIPALFIHDISFDDAKTIALMSNALASAETDVERADVYRHMRHSMKTSEEIEKFGKKCEKANRPRIRSYSFLESNGLTMDTLYAFETGEDSANLIKTIARRIGELRRKLPEISKVHENELFDRLLNKWIYGKNKQKWELYRMEDFIDLVKNHVQALKIRWELDPHTPLNINKIKNLSYIMQHYHQTLDAFRSKKKIFLEEFHKTRRKISRLKTCEEIPQDKKLFIQELENKLWISLKTLNNMEDVHTATDILFAVDEVYLSPEEDLDKLEEAQKVILEAIQNIEQEYYIYLQKKPLIEQQEKNVIEIDFD